MGQFVNSDMYNKLVAVTFLMLILTTSIAFSQNSGYCTVRHDISKVGLARSNDQFFGGSNNRDFPDFDCFTGEEIPIGSCLYPKNSLITYLGYGAAWVGGIVRGDTLVSSYALWPASGLPLNSAL